MEWLQLDLKTLSKRGNKFVSEIKCFPPPSKRAALGFFFLIKEEKWTARSEIIVFIQPIELYKMKLLS